MDFLTEKLRLRELCYETEKKIIFFLQRNRAYWLTIHNLDLSSSPNRNLFNRCIEKMKLKEEEDSTLSSVQYVQWNMSLKGRSIE